ncbi:MAG: hypothetical protein EOO08_07135 [Chitinophagaceae bacterium]|nr:MAG: hypothetical protein EOO08_07135 [Chitinophagaceae bacterium]
MQFADFKLLPIRHQARILCEQGVLLCERLEDAYLIALYMVDDFYVEVYYRTQGQEIEKFRSFHSSELLAPYIPAICFEELRA